MSSPSAACREGSPFGSAGRAVARPPGAASERRRGPLGLLAREIVLIARPFYCNQMGGIGHVNAQWFMRCTMSPTLYGTELLPPVPDWLKEVITEASPELVRHVEEEVPMLNGKPSAKHGDLRRRRQQLARRPAGEGRRRERIVARDVFAKGTIDRSTLALPSAA